MAVTIDTATTAAISLDEYVEFCDAHPDLQDPERVIESAGRLRELANNKRFLAEYLNGQLKDLATFQEGNDFKPSTFILHRGKGYTIRAVVWLPEREADNPGIFSYYETHDHNFDFLTCGYHGSGYRTVLYRYDHDRVVGYPGEKVDLELLEDTTLPEGKVMYYFSSRDVHTQLPPEELSISLNLILPRKGPRKPQYLFDPERKTVLARFSEMRLRRSIFAAVAHVGDENSVDILSAIAREHSDYRTRGLAWETLMRRKPEEADAFRSAALGDAHPYVVAMARALSLSSADRRRPAG